MVQLAEAVLDPGLVRVLGVRRAAEDLAVGRLELLVAPRELLDLGGTDEGEIRRIEEEDHVLPVVIRQRGLLEVPVADHRVDGEFRGFLGDETHRDSFRVVVQRSVSPNTSTGFRGVRRATNDCLRAMLGRRSRDDVSLGMARWSARSPGPLLRRWQLRL